MAMLTYGNSVAIPAIAKTKKYEAISEGFLAAHRGFELRTAT
jgi:hypothetical protein